MVRADTASMVVRRMQAVVTENLASEARWRIEQGLAAFDEAGFQARSQQLLQQELEKLPGWDHSQVVHLLSGWVPDREDVERVAQQTSDPWIPDAPISAPPEARRGGPPGGVLSDADRDALVQSIAAEVAKAQDIAATEAEQPLQAEERTEDARQRILTELDAISRDRMATGTQPNQIDERWIHDAVLEELFGFGALAPLLADDDITDILINGHDHVTLIRGDGTHDYSWPAVTHSDAELITLIRRLVAQSFKAGGTTAQRSFTPAQPAINFKLIDGSRCHAAAWTTPRPSVSIRRHRLLRASLTDLETYRTVSPQQRAFLEAAVKARKNIIIAGPPGGGKTTLLRALVDVTPVTERIITVESEWELSLEELPGRAGHIVAFEARPPNNEGIGGFSEADAIRETLRMSPDRVMVGEIRGAEIVQMLEAMSTGLDGSMCTVHAESADRVMSKLTTYAWKAQPPVPDELMVRMVTESVHLFVVLRRASHGRGGVVAEISEVAGMSGGRLLLNHVFIPGPDDGRGVPAGPGFSDRLRADLDAQGFDFATLERHY